MQWNDDQKRAIDEVLLWVNKSTMDPLMSLTGPAGTGKTTILSAIKPFLSGKSVGWCGMTGKAAVRLSQVNDVSATTLHKILYQPPRQSATSPEFTTIAPPPHDYVIVDEASMMSPKVFQDIQVWTKKGIRILLVGDGYQLPPVMSHKEIEEHGEDFSVFGKVKGPALTEVMRSDDEIIRVATELRTTFRVPRSGGDSYAFKMLERPGRRAVEAYLEQQEDHAIITWRNQLRMQANAAIRKKLGHRETFPQKGEPVMCCRNGQQVMNGEIYETMDFSDGFNLGDVKTSWFRTAYGDRILTSTVGRDQKMDGFMPNIPNWRAYHSARRAMDAPIPIPVTYGYVYTAHKAQGSEFEKVTVFLDSSDTGNPHFRKDTRLPDGSTMPFASRWLYTALTRAKSQVTLLIGS
jgi:exodeoxyribonuclease-5